MPVIEESKREMSKHSDNCASSNDSQTDLYDEPQTFQDILKR